MMRTEAVRNHNNGPINEARTRAQGNNPAGHLARTTTLGDVLKDAVINLLGLEPQSGRSRDVVALHAKQLAA